MLLPYDMTVWFAEMAAYNAGWSPLPALAWLLAAGAVLWVWMKPGDRAAGRAVLGLLAAMWLFTGAAHQWGHMAALNFLAPVYGGFWIAQGGMLALVALFWRGGFHVGPAALALALGGLVAHPLALLALGHAAGSLPLAGTAPDPTALLTAGLLLAARPHPPLWLFAIPLGWAGVAGVSAWLLGFGLGYAVAAALAGAAGMAAWRRAPITRNP